MGNIPPITLLLEFVSPSDAVPLEPLVERVLNDALEKSWATDGVLAASEQQRHEMWAVRESIPEGQKLHGIQLKHDVSVPVKSLNDFITAATQKASEVMPTILVNPFGHLADGNVHFNFSAPPGEEAEMLASREALNHAVYDVVVAFNGSIAAEHGLGRSKVALADRVRSPIERNLMKQLKCALDPDNFMNPGVIVADSDAVPG